MRERADKIRKRESDFEGESKGLGLDQNVKGFPACSVNLKPYFLKKEVSPG